MNGAAMQMNRTRLRIPCVAIVLIAFVFSSVACGIHTTPFRDVRGHVIPGSIAMMTDATIGGVKQCLDNEAGIASGHVRNPIFGGRGERLKSRSRCRALRLYAIRDCASAITPAHGPLGGRDRPSIVRQSGREGSCHAHDYRPSAECLLVLRKATGDFSWTTRWYPLGPVNEQLRGVDDPWLLWARDRLK
jgi:hypothetical protein